MTNLKAALMGKKTYILAALGVLTVLASHFHYITTDTANMLLGLFGFGGLAAFRASVSSVAEQVTSQLFNVQQPIPTGAIYTANPDVVQTPPQQ